MEVFCIKRERSFDFFPLGTQMSHVSPSQLIIHFEWTERGPAVPETPTWHDTREMSRRMRWRMTRGAEPSHGKACSSAISGLLK